MSDCRRVVVIVPAHNEAQMLPDCLAALDVSRLSMPREVTVEVLVVLDDCTDRSAEIARAARVRTLPVRARNVGMARHAGALAAIGTDPAGTWLASTDADSLVPGDWLRTHLAAADAGWDALAGTVRVRDWTGRPPTVRRRFDHVYRPADGHRHVHGANLGVTAAAYLRVGGYPSIPTSEDVALLDALNRAGARVLRTATAPVTTSARLEARAPNGFAHALSTMY
jgi:glycosyltransferase involved in cell wall biosynthesis